MPGDAVTGKIATRRQLRLSGAAGIGNAHGATGERIAKVFGMKVALVPDTGWEGAAENPHFRRFMNFFADGPTLPPRLQRIGQSVRMSDRHEQ